MTPQQIPTTVRISKLDRMIAAMFLDVLLTSIVGMTVTALVIRMIFVVITSNMLVASFLVPSSWTLLVLAVSIPCSGAYGFYTAIRQKLQKIKLYSLFMLVTMLVSLITGCYTCFLTYTNNDAQNSHLNEAIINYHLNATVKGRIDVIQSTLSCCGVKDAEDWNNNALFACKPGNLNIEKCSVPASCCLLNKSNTVNNTMLKNCGINALNLSSSEKKERINIKGCQEIIDGLLYSSTMSLLSMYVLLAICQFYLLRRSRNIIDAYIEGR